MQENKKQEIKAIIIDDESRARNLLSNLLEDHCGDIKVIGAAANVPDGVLLINKHKPDVVFLDIEMPNYSGFKLLSFFKQVDFEIIFVTAYHKYAVEAFKVSAVDYLLKPLRVDLLEEAIEKLRTKISLTSMTDRLQILKTNLEDKKIKKIAVPVAEGLLFVKVEEISHVEANGSYANLFLTDGSKMTVSKNLKYFATALEGHTGFYRVHRSYLVNLANIAKYNRQDSLIHLENGTYINVARDAKTSFEGALKALHTI